MGGVAVADGSFDEVAVGVDWGFHYCAADSWQEFGLSGAGC